MFVFLGCKAHENQYGPVSKVHLRMVSAQLSALNGHPDVLMICIYTARFVELFGCPTFCLCGFKISSDIERVPGLPDVYLSIFFPNTPRVESADTVLIQILARQLQR